MKYPQNSQFCRVNTTGETDYQFFGPFGDWETACRFGELLINSIQSFEVCGEDEMPDNVQVTNPEEVEMEDGET